MARRAACSELDSSRSNLSPPVVSAMLFCSGLSSPEVDVSWCGEPVWASCEVSLTTRLLVVAIVLVLPRLGRYFRGDDDFLWPKKHQKTPFPGLAPPYFAACAPHALRVHSLGTAPRPVCENTVGRGKSPSTAEAKVVVSKPQPLKRLKFTTELFPRFPRRLMSITNARLGRPHGTARTPIDLKIGSRDSGRRLVRSRGKNNALRED